MDVAAAVVNTAKVQANKNGRGRSKGPRYGFHLYHLCLFEDIWNKHSYTKDDLDSQNI